MRFFVDSPFKELMQAHMTLNRQPIGSFEAGELMLFVIEGERIDGKLISICELRYVPNAKATAFNQPCDWPIPMGPISEEVMTWPVTRS